jgi:hypothetical protein
MGGLVLALLRKYWMVEVANKIIGCSVCFEHGAQGASCNTRLNKEKAEDACSLKDMFHVFNELVVPWYLYRMTCFEQWQLALANASANSFPAASAETGSKNAEHISKMRRGNVVAAQKQLETSRGHF